MRRLIDSVVSLGLMVIASPLLALISIAIKMTSKGPILFIQRRIGKDNKEFLLYKFRTMKTNAPNIATHLLNNPDQFITPIGRLLRKTSLDELPQLINILKGEMTFIGPRPALYNQYDLIGMRTAAGVHRLLPGVTGWAQINGRDALKLADKVEYDTYYMRNKSLAFDIRIFILTFIKVIRAEGILDGTNQNAKVQNEKANM